MIVIQLKSVSTDDDMLKLRTPRDRDSSFKLLLMKKYQTRITGIANHILSQYAKGIITRKGATAFKESYMTPMFLWRWFQGYQCHN